MPSSTQTCLYLRFLIDEYLAGRITEDEIEWYEWNYALYSLRKADYWGVRETLTPYYRKFMMADKGFFRNGSTDTHLVAANHPDA